MPLAADVWTYMACNDDRRLVPAAYGMPADVRRDDPPPLLPHTLFRWTGISQHASLGLSRRISPSLIVHIRKVPLNWEDGACRESCPRQIRRHFPSEEYRLPRQDHRIC